MMEQRLTLVAELPQRSKDGHIVGLYACKCGGQVSVIKSRVSNGYTKSCGCLNREAKPGLTHGGHSSPTYRSWSAMKVRCLNPTSKDYPKWGGRGITICESWISFENFLRDMGPRPAGTTIDRIDPEKGYDPDNCRWATPRQQAHNRRDLVSVRIGERTIPLADYAKEIGLSRGAAHLRLKRGKLEGATRA